MAEAKRSNKKQQFGRQALGRGLSTLMRSTTVEVDVGEQLGKRGKQAAERPAAPERLAAKKRTPSAPAQAAAPDEAPVEGLALLPIHRVFPNARQPRTRFEESDVQSLAASIRESGVLQPILVRRRSAVTGDSHYAGDVDGFEIIAGERRYRAAKAAGLSEIPAVVREIDDREALEIGIVENVQRTDLNPIELALAYQRLVDEFELSQEAVAKTVGKDRASIANALRLLRLPENVRELLVDGAISAGHGRALLMLDSASKQSALASLIVKEQLSVREAERLASSGEARGGRKRGRTAARPEEKSGVELQLEERLRRSLGTKVGVTLSKNGSGELKISFFSREELDRLLEHLQV